MMTRILVVDDEVDFTKMLQIRLESRGRYLVRVVNDPRDALPAAHEFRPHLVLMDIMMPYIDGSELAACMLSDDQLKHIPMVFLTALVTKAETMEKTCGIGSKRIYLPKPLDYDHLLQCIEEQIRQHPAAV